MTRIIAGAAKGRRLAVPTSGTRPTSDRAREGLFNALAARVRLEGARVLDLFAGTGAVGLEALSRGAAAAVLVESNARAATVLRANVDAVGLAGARVVAAPVNRYLAGEPDDTFDLVFADPPYALGEDQMTGLVAAVLDRWLAPAGTIVVERSRRAGAPAHGNAALEPWYGRDYGETTLWYGRRS